jgi:hypothetical protein
MAVRGAWLWAAVCGLLVASVAAHSHGGVEDQHGRMVPGAKVPKDGKMMPHHFDLFFQTLLCVSFLLPLPAPVAAQMPVDRLFTAMMFVVAQFAEHADVSGLCPHYSFYSILRLRHVGRQRHCRKASEEEKEDEGRWGREGRLALKACRDGRWRDLMVCSTLTA